MITHSAKEAGQQKEQWGLGVVSDREVGVEWGGGWTKFEKKGEVGRIRALHKIGG